METYTDKLGIVHFESPELNIPHGEHPVGSVFYFPQAWIKVLAWGQPATLIGYRELAYPKGHHVLSVVFENETGMTGVDPSKVVDFETGLPISQNPPRTKVERRAVNTGKKEPARERPKKKKDKKRKKRKR